MVSPTLLFRTVRHLRPTQVASRLYYRVADSLTSLDTWSRRRRVTVGKCCWRPRIRFQAPEQQGNSEEGIRRGCFRFQNDAREMGCPIHWNRDDLPLLWRYSLHYFDYLWSLGFEASRAIALDWIERHPIGYSQVGWAPYPTSLRLLNWCTFFFGMHRQQTEADTRFCRAIRESIGQQTARLSCRLEYHLLGNHLLENAAALAVVGSCFDGPDASRWLDAGLRLLRRELPEQVLADGVHFELSPMYHSRVVFLLLTLANVLPEESREWLGEYAAKMLDALMLLSHPDGHIALLNDSAFGVYNTLSELADFGRRLGVQRTPITTKAETTFALKDAGYYGARTAQGHYLICDAGRVGPDYIPGHAHGDIFSFELSLSGDRIVVDSGVYDYGDGDMRRYCRSTAAHNTVEISGHDQCEFWDVFKVGRRGRPEGIEFHEEPGGFTLRSRHDGYSHLTGRPMHHREFRWNRQGILVVRDRVKSESNVPFVSRVHLHPACRVSEVRESGLVLERGGRRYRLQADGARLRIDKSWYCPEFGVREENMVVALIPSEVTRETCFCLAPDLLAGAESALTE